jgi:hypothetical protein
MFYSSTILTSLKLGPNYITALVGLVTLLAVLPTIILFKHIGRKTILWIFGFLMAASLIGLGVCLIMNS